MAPVDRCPTHSAPTSPFGKYLGGGKGCGHLPQSQGAPQAGSTSLPEDGTVAGSNGAGASLEVVGIREQRSAPRGSKVPLLTNQRWAGGLKVKH